VLATASRPVVVAPVSGGTVSTEFRYVYNPGSITGVIYRDDDGSGTFNPDSDTPAPGMTVRLYAGEGTTGEPLAETATSAAGAYEFHTLRPGRYTLAVVPFPTTDIVEGATRVVDVLPAQALSAEFVFTGTLLIPIAEARARAVGESVTVEGVVHVAQGTLRTDNAYIQDGTAGILVFGIPAATGLVVGDSVRVTGTRGVFNDEVQITSPTVERLGTGATPTPRVLTPAQILAFEHQGELVQALNLRVTAIAGGTGAAFDVTTQAETGETIMVRVGGAGTGLTRASFEVGRRYNVVGAMGRFRATPQILVRSPADIPLYTGPTPIAEAKGVALNDTVFVEGIVTAAQGTFRTDNIYLQDASGGIQVFNVPTGLGLELGERIQVRGLMGEFSTERQIVRFSSTEPLIVTRIGTAAVPAPRLTTGQEIVARTYDGLLVVTQNARLTAPPAGTSGAYNLTFEAADGTEFTLRIDGLVANTVPRSFWEANAHYDLVGVLGAHVSVGAQLKPRGPADITKR
jgi:hypothetical protein